MVYEEIIRKCSQLTVRVRAILKNVNSHVPISPYEPTGNTPMRVTSYTKRIYNEMCWYAVDPQLHTNDQDNRLIVWCTEYYILP